jgi:PAP2 superfamily
MVKEVYDASRTSTEEQKTMAKYWADVGTNKGYTPPGHVMSVVTQALEQDRADLGRAAEVYAKSGIAIRDAVITLWKFKYHYNQVRPVTYIRKLIDPDWLPLIPTPPHPEYPAAHAYITSSVMRVLSEEVGDHTSITDHTYDFLGFAPRKFSSFDALAEEVGQSRFYGGIHYKNSIMVGRKIGTEIGNNAANIQLVPR